MTPTETILVLIVVAAWALVALLVARLDRALRQPQRTPHTDTPTPDVNDPAQKSTTTSRRVEHGPW